MMFFAAPMKSPRKALTARNGAEQKTLGSKRAQMKRVLGPGGVSFLFLLVVVGYGCAGPVPRPVTRPDPPGGPAEPRAASRSDRLRGDPTQASPAVGAPSPARAIERAEPSRVDPQPPAPTSEAAPPQGTEPDPLAVIDWLLKQRK